MDLSEVPKDCVERAAAFLREEPFAFRDEEPLCFSCGDAGGGCIDCAPCEEKWYYKSRLRHLAGVPPTVRSVSQVQAGRGRRREGDVVKRPPTGGHVLIAAPVAAVMCSVSPFPPAVPGTFFGVVCGDRK